MVWIKTRWELHQYGKMKGYLWRNRWREWFYKTRKEFEGRTGNPFLLFTFSILQMHETTSRLGMGMGMSLLPEDYPLRMARENIMILIEGKIGWSLLTGLQRKLPPKLLEEIIYQLYRFRRDQKREDFQRWYKTFQEGKS